MLFTKQLFRSPKINISSVVMACKRNKEPMQKKSLILQKKHEWLYSCWKLDQIGLICVSRNNHISLIWLPITFQTALCPFIEAQREKNWVSASDWGDFCGFWAAVKNLDLDQIKKDWQNKTKLTMRFLHLSSWSVQVVRVVRLVSIVGVFRMPVSWKIKLIDISIK